MKSHILFFAAALMLPAIPALAQSPAAPPFAFTSKADVEALAAKLKAENKPGASSVGQILNLGPYRATIEYRGSTTPPSIHRSQAELIYVVDGSCSLRIGGTILNPTGPSENRLVGTAIEGGTLRKVVKGDWVLLPENTAHQFTEVNNLVTMSAHLVFPK